MAHQPEEDRTTTPPRGNVVLSNISDLALINTRVV